MHEGAPTPAQAGVTSDWLLDMAMTLDRTDVPLGARAQFVKRELAEKCKALLAAGKTGEAAHSKSEYKRRVAMGDPNVAPPGGVSECACDNGHRPTNDACPVNAGGPTFGVEGRKP